MTTPKTPKTRRRVIDLQDLTLEQTDELEEVTTEFGVGYRVAAAYVVLKAERPELTIDEVRKMSNREVQVLAGKEDDEDPSGSERS